MPKPQVRLRVITRPDPRTRVILDHAGKSPMVMGTDRSAPDLVCGSCESALVTGFAERAFYNVVFLCQICGAFNELMLV
ncbi:MAG TPA: hypothetical protein VH702_16085 [Vicinamibacterales bacterium]